VKPILTDALVATMVELLARGDMSQAQVAGHAGVDPKALQHWLALGRPGALQHLARCSTLARARAVGNEAACHAAAKEEQVASSRPPAAGRRH